MPPPELHQPFVSLFEVHLCLDSLGFRVREVTDRPSFQFCDAMLCSDDRVIVQSANWVLMTLTARACNVRCLEYQHVSCILASSMTPQVTR